MQLIAPWVPMFRTLDMRADDCYAGHNYKGDLVSKSCLDCF